jgi:Restriction endonuclease
MRYWSATGEAIACRPMKPWEQYQEDTAELLRELGFTTGVNDSLTEPNGTVHEVDVSARRTLAGVDLLWIVECKLWRTQAVTIEKVAALKAIVDSVGADRGLLMSEGGFQSGAIRMAVQKNITLSSLADLRESAAEELLAAKVTAADRRLLNLTRRSVRELRTFGPEIPQILPALAAQLSPEDVDEFTMRPDAVNFLAGLEEIISKTGNAAFQALLPPDFNPAEMHRAWKDGVDTSVMDEAARMIGFLTQALNQGKLGDWPVTCPSPSGPKLAWSVPQLLQIVEPAIASLERTVAEQEGKVA